MAGPREGHHQFSSFDPLQNQSFEATLLLIFALLLVSVLCKRNVSYFIFSVILAN